MLVEVFLPSGSFDAVIGLPLAQELLDLLKEPVVLVVDCCPIQENLDPQHEDDVQIRDDLGQQFVDFSVDVFVLFVLEVVVLHLQPFLAVVV